MQAITINGKGAGRQTGNSFRHFTGYIVAQLGESPRLYNLVQGAAWWGGYWAVMECTQTNREVVVFDTRKAAVQHIEASQL